MYPYTPYFLKYSQSGRPLYFRFNFPRVMSGIPNLIIRISCHIGIITTLLFRLKRHFWVSWEWSYWPSVDRVFPKVVTSSFVQFILNNLLSSFSPVSFLTDGAFCKFNLMPELILCLLNAHSYHLHYYDFHYSWELTHEQSNTPIITVQFVNKAEDSPAKTSHCLW